MALDRIRRGLESPAADAVVRVVVVLSVLATSLLAWRLQDLVGCVAHYNDVNNQRTVILTQATDEERAAEQKADLAQAALFTSPILTKPASQRTPAENSRLLSLFRAYQMALTEQTTERKEADRARAEHPVPDPPKDVCGTVSQKP